MSFSITQQPNGANGASLSATSVVTDPSGLASTQLTLGDIGGTYQVTASCVGQACTPGSVTFSEMGCPVNVRFSQRGGIQQLTDMLAFFTPRSGQTLKAAASACGFAGFDWQQTITFLPCPSPYCPNNPSAIPSQDFCPSAPQKCDNYLSQTQPQSPSLEEFYLQPGFP